MKRYPREKFDHKTFDFFKFKIIVPDEKTKEEMIKSFKHLHDSHDIDTDLVLVNQLVQVHTYEESRNIEIGEV